MRITVKKSPGRKARPVSDRMNDQLVKTLNGCLEWQGHRRSDGYGVLGIGSRSDGSRRIVRAHCLAWELAFGSIPDGLCVLHHCDNPPCCETEPSEAYPEGHLFLGTRSDNSADKVAKKRHRNGKTIKLSPGKAEWIRHASAEGMTAVAIADAIGVSKATVWRVLRGAAWVRRAA